MKIAAIILARSGSKRLRNKNMLNFNGSSLLHDVVELAYKSKVDGIIVSTDSNSYFQEVKDMSSKILDIGLRSTKNSDDESTDLDVVCELMKKIPKHELPDLIVHLRATSPAVAVEQVNKAIDIMKNTNATSLKSAEKLELLAEKTVVGKGMVR